MTQLDPNLTIASIPDMLVYDPYQQQTIPFAGRLFLHRWPEPLADPFAGVLAALPPVNGATATATGDANQNGVPNLIDWLMGQDPGNKPNYWDTQVPLGKVPFLKYDHETRKLRYMVPQLRSALRHIVNIEISHDLIEWRAVPKARWEAQEDVLIPTADGSKATSYFMPVLIPTYDLDPGRSIFVRMSAE